MRQTLSRSMPHQNSITTRGTIPFIHATLYWYPLVVEMTRYSHADTILCISWQTEWYVLTMSIDTNLCLKPQFRKSFCASPHGSLLTNILKPVKMWYTDTPCLLLSNDDRSCLWLVTASLFPCFVSDEDDQWLTKSFFLPPRVRVMKSSSSLLNSFLMIPSSIGDCAVSNFDVDFEITWLGFWKINAFPALPFHPLPNLLGLLLLFLSISRIVCQDTQYDMILSHFGWGLKP